MSPDNLIDVYNRTRDRLYGQHRRGGAHPGNWKDHQAAQAFLAWCDEHDLDPEHYVESYCEMQYRTRGFVPRINALRSKRALGAAHVSDTTHRAERAERKKASESPHAFEAFVKSLRLESPVHEFQRETMIGREELCMLLMDSATGGYDPRSRVCAGCPLAVRCGEELRRRAGFDVVALRAGRFHQLDPEVAAAALR